MALTITGTGVKGINFRVEVASNSAVTLTVTNGKVVYTNAAGDTATYAGTSALGATVANFAPGGISLVNIVGNTDVTMTAATFAAVVAGGNGLKFSGPAESINANGASSSLMNTLAANTAFIGAGAITNATVNGAQFASILNGVNGSGFATGGALKVNAAGATSTQLEAMFSNAGSTAIAAGTAANGIYNLTLNADLAGGITAGQLADVRTGGIIKVDLAGTSGANLAGLAGVADKIVNGSIINAGSVNNAVTGATFVTLANEFANGAVKSLDVNAGITFAELSSGLTKVANNAVFNAANLTASQFSTLAAKLAVGGAVTSVNAAGATAAQLNALVSNASKLDNNVVTNASLTISQFVSLETNAAGSKIGPNGALTVNASGASATQLQTLVLNAADVAAGGATTGVFNAKLTGAQFNQLALNNPANTNILRAGGVVQLNASDLDAAGMTALFANNSNNIAANAISKATVTGASFAANANLFANGGVVSVSALDANNEFAAVIANSAKLVKGALHNVTNLTVDQFMQITSLLAAGGVSGLSLQGATSSQEAAVAANAAKFANASITNADITAAQFASLVSKIANNDNANNIVGAVAIDAANASSGAVSAIVANMPKIGVEAVSGLTMTAAQYNASPDFAALGDVINGVLAVKATSASTIGSTTSLAAYGTQGTGTHAVATETLSITGSSGSDTIYAGVNNDTVNAGSGNDSVQAGGGDDWVSGGDGNDTVVAGAGADTLLGGNGNDSLSGGAGNDSIDGGAGNDALTGGTGNDTFNISAGSDTISDLGDDDGGPGRDILLVSAGAKVNATVSSSWTASNASQNWGTATITLADGQDVALGAIAAGNGFTVTAAGNASASTVGGSVFADTIIGGSAGDSVEAGTGNDSLFGGAGDDTLTGGGGVDTFNVSSGTDNVLDLGTGGADVLIVANGATAQATVTADWTATAATTNAGDAALTLGAATAVNLSGATLVGTNGYTVATSNTASSVTGSGGDDSITGGNGTDTLLGGNGDDTLGGGAANDTVTGGAGADTFNVTAATDSVTDLGNGADVLAVSAGATATATVVANWTATDATANAGTANLTLATSANTVNLSAATQANNVGYTVAAAANTASTITGSSGRDTITGSTGADSLNGGADNDTLTGGTGVDRFTVAAGTDTITDLGNGGADVLVVSDAALVNATVAANYVASASNSNTSAGAVTLTGDFNMNMAAATGTAGYTLNGGNSANTLVGSAYADILSGGVGNDALTGGAGLDRFDVTSGTDTISDLGLNDQAEILVVSNGAIANATVAGNWTADVTTNNGGTATLTMASTSSEVNLAAANAGTTGFTVTASGLVASTITGSAGNDTITGSAAADSIVGGGGNDRLTGGTSADTFNVTSGTDTITDLGNGGADVLIAAATATAVNATVVNDWTATSSTTKASGVAVTLNMTAAADVVNLTSAGVSGGGNVGYIVNAEAATASVITGSAKQDTITGSSANDIITGGAEADTMVGAGGDDTFVIAAIADFAAGESITDSGGADVIQFGAAGAITYVGRTVTGIETLDLTASATNAVVVTQGTGLSSVLDLGVINATLTLNKDTTNFDASAKQTAADVVGAGDWNYTAGQVNGVLTYYDEVASNIVAITLVGVEAGALTGGVANVNNNLKFTQA